MFGFIIALVVILIGGSIYSCCVVAGKSDRKMGYDYYSEQDTYEVVENENR